MFSGIVPTISPALPVQRDVSAYEVSGGLTCVKLMLLTPTYLLLMTIPVDFRGCAGR
jgi:hypothetical protein